MKKKPVTAAMFKKMTGFAPEQDDLERCNCPERGGWGHRYCGICPKHNQPRFICGCGKWSKKARAKNG